MSHRVARHPTTSRTMLGSCAAGLACACDVMIVCWFLHQRPLPPSSCLLLPLPCRTPASTSHPQPQPLRGGSTSRFTNGGSESSLFSLSFVASHARSCVCREREREDSGGRLEVSSDFASSGVKNNGGWCMCG